MSRIHQRSGRRAVRAAAWVLATFALGACAYGFEGGGFPSHIRTIYIQPFENQTAHFDVEQELFTRLIEELPAKLGLQAAGRENADAILMGQIRRYQDQAQNYSPSSEQAAGNVLSHQVQIGISAQIVDVRDNVIRWESSSLVGRGEYNPGSENDDIAQQEAIDNIIDQIIDGAQSQW
ncbi:MAG: LptE family protein [Longimicrobiales bacterium]